MEEDVVFFDKTIHLNKFTEEFNLEAEERAHVLEQLVVSVDGAIMGVKRAKVEPFFSDPEVRKLRYGVVRMPKNIKLENEDDFYRLLAILTPLEETS